MASGPVSKGILRVSVQKVLPCGAVQAPLLETNLVDLLETRLKRKMEQKANVGSALEKWLIWLLIIL